MPTMRKKQIIQFKENKPYYIIEYNKEEKYVSENSKYQVVPEYINDEDVRIKVCKFGVFDKFKFENVKYTNRKLYYSSKGRTIILYENNEKVYFINSC